MTTSRLQLALNVSDIDAATAFYRDLFGVEPAKQRPGYANFEIADPPLKLVLFHNPDAASPLNHLGVEVATTAEVVAAAGRFASVGLHHTDDRSRPLLPRRAGQGVGRRPRRAARAPGSSTPSSPTTPATSDPARPVRAARRRRPTPGRAAPACQEA